MKQIPKIQIIAFLLVFAVVQAHAQTLSPESAIPLKSDRHLIPNDNPANRGQIFVMKHDGSALRQLTHDKNFSSSNPSLSKNGRRITFESDADLVPGGNPTNRPQIFVMSGDGTALRQLTHNKVYTSSTPQISGDGKHIVFRSDADLIPGRNPSNELQIFVINSDGTALRQLTHDKTLPSYNPSISGDGSRIAFESDAELIPGGNPSNETQIFVINSNGTGLRQLTHDNTNPSSSPSISGDGSRIAFVSDADLIPGGNPSNESQLFIINSNGTALRQLTQDKVFFSANPKISEDGRRIAFESDADLIPGGNPTNRGQIFVINSNGTALRQLTRDQVFSSSNPSISGDGSRIAFHSNAILISGGNPTNRGQIFVINRQGSGLTQLTNNTENHSQSPNISGDGKIIVFQSWANLNKP